MPIENRNLKPGTKLVGRYRKQSYSCEVVEGEGGKLRYRLADGREFKSPSAAGMAITSHACDGWVFWSVRTTQTPVSETEAETRQEATRPTVLESTDGKACLEIPAVETNLLKTGIYKLPNQRGVPQGQTRWYCRECKQSLLAPEGEIPEVCSKGHKAS